MYNRLKLSITSLLAILICNIICAQNKPMLCFTFDDGNPNDILDYKAEVWNRMILNHLKDNELQAALYVRGKGMDNAKGREILESWNSAGHLIANHTYSHWNFNSSKINAKEYFDDINKNDSLLSMYGNYKKYFRAPFLKYGDTKQKRDSLNSYLKNNGFANGYVTIDASDWYYNSELIKFIKANPGSSIDAYKKLYLEHLLDRAKYYDDLAYELLGRRIKHSLLLHHNLTSSLFLGDLISAFEDNGWEIIDAAEALTDDIYYKIPDIVPAGESLIWGLAKETGRYNDKLRYPGEDSIYEEDKLGNLEN